MKVQLHPADEGGCGFYRMTWPAMAAQAAGVDVEVCYPDTDSARLHLLLSDTAHGPRVVGLASTPDTDVLVLQRPLQRHLADAIPHLQAAGVAVVVELDDDFQGIHRKNAAWPNCQPRTSPERNWQHLQRACSAADLVTTTTVKLAEKYARHGRAAVVPNYLPGDLWRRVVPAEQSTTERQLLGWSGSVTTHPTDLGQAATAVRTVLADPQWELGVVGTGIGVREAMGLPGADADEAERAPMHASGWVDLMDYPAEVARLHAGFVPLDSTPFNEAKSWLKGLEMAAAGAPFVASATGPYRELCRRGMGVVAEKPRDWNRMLGKLAGDHRMRADLAAEYREVALDTMLVEQHVDEWVAAWTTARVQLRARQPIRVDS